MKAACATLILVAAFAAPVAAAERCDVPVDQWQPREALQTKLEKEGWKVRKIKTEDGCYEAYAVNAAGKKMETFFNPQTLEAVGDDGEG
jgi:hypothetical protein